MNRLLPDCVVPDTRNVDGCLNRIIVVVVVVVVAACRCECCQLTNYCIDAQLFYTFCDVGVAAAGAAGTGAAAGARGGASRYLFR